MSLDFAILGFLNYQPFTGYDLKKIFDNSVHHFWTADQSQIYRTLTRLTQQGLARVEIVEQVDRPDRKVYSITPAGRQALSEWLRGPFPFEETRSASLIQVFFAGQLSDQEIIEKFESAAGKIRALLGHYQDVPLVIADYVQSVGTPREGFCWMLTLEFGIRNAQTTLEWMESVIRRVRNHELPASQSA